MPIASLRSGARRLSLLAALSVLALFSLACLATVDGERAATGECPPGETCSEATPTGLQFVGRSFFDESMVRLGPVLVGGTFEVGLQTADGEALPAFAASSNDGVFQVTRGEGVFGPVEDGEALYPVDAHLVLRALRPGFSQVRITDPSSGALFDRLELEAVALEDVSVVVAQEPEREQLYAGCREMIGIRLLAEDGTTEFRAFDHGIVVRADGTTLEEEPLFWDCVLYDVPADATQTSIEVDAAGRAFHHTFAVQSLESAGLAECPELVD